MVAHIWPSPTLQCHHVPQHKGLQQQVQQTLMERQGRVALHRDAPWSRAPTSVPRAPASSTHSSCSPRQQSYQRGRLTPRSEVTRSVQVEGGKAAQRRAGVGADGDIAQQQRVYDHQGLCSLHAHPKQKNRKAIRLKSRLFNNNKKKNNPRQTHFICLLMP